VATSPFLKTRVARRILLLFLLCAMTPLTLLAGLGYRHLAEDLETMARDHLRDQTKTSGMMLLDRLGSLAALLETIAGRVEPDRALRQETRSAPAEEIAGPRFQALGIVPARGPVLSIIGELPVLPHLLADQEEHLRRGGVALVSQPGRDGVQIFLVREIQARPGTRLWGYIEPASVYGLNPATSVAPQGMVACLTQETGEVILCPAPETLGAAAPRTGSFHWKRGANGFLAARWTVFLRRYYAAPSWTISLSVPDTVVSAPLAGIRRIFLLGLGLALAVVFTLAHIQLRRNMEPLEALEAGTLRMAAGRFDDPVVVRSGDEFQALAGSFNRMASDLRHQFGYQHALARVHEAALAATGPEAVLRALVRGQSALVPGGSVTIALANPDAPDHWTAIRGQDETGLMPREVRPTAVELEKLSGCGPGFAVEPGERAPSYCGMGRDELLDAALVLPLRWRGALTGALVLTGGEEVKRREGYLADARRTADEVALAISNAQLVNQLDEMNWGALTALARAIDAVSPWTAGHSERVTLGAVRIGRGLGLSEDQIDQLHRGGLLHDVGKVGVPASILDKPGKLTDEEFARIRLHPTMGARILAPIGAFRRAMPLVLHHHELLDGSGYPHGLSGEQIPLMVRILTVADVFDALVSDRPYRAAWPVDHAVGYLRNNADTKFDRRAVEALATAVESGWRPVASAPVMVTGASGRFSLWPTAETELKPEEAAAVRSA